uniref:Uncharacterized protein n=1 Tax=Anguilla anguilla TaxID=7936 RepID=A0A0E9VAG1_ANGAN
MSKSSLLKLLADPFPECKEKTPKIKITTQH